MSLICKSKNLVLVFSFLLLSGCGGGNGDNENPEKDKNRRSINDMTIAERKQSVMSAIEALERDGLLPTLDNNDSRPGEDLDQNGIRDDIDFYINEKSYTEDDRVLLKIIANALQDIQTAHHITPEFADGIFLKISASQQCIDKKSSDPKHLRNIARTLVFYTANTEKRMARMADYEAEILTGEIPSVDCNRISFFENYWINPSNFKTNSTQNNNFNQTCFQQVLPPRDRIGLGFFNGVKNLKSDGEESLKETYEAIQKEGKSWNIEDRHYYTSELFYNDSHSLFKDVIETFRQRAASKGLSPEAEVLIENHPELIALLKDPNGNPNSYEFKRHLDNFEFFTLVNSFRSLQAEFGNHGDELEEIYARHRAKIEKWKNEDRKMILVAHSQGNLFVNKAYEAALEMGVSPDDIKVVHIAPASIELNGEYILADVDAIIRPLPNTPPFNAYNGYTRFSDPTGHSYIKTYLNPNLDSGIKTIDAIVNAYSSVSDHSQILDYSQDEINRLFYPKIYLNPSMELFRFYATSDNWTNDIKVGVKEYSGDLLSPNEDKSDYANNVKSINDDPSGGDILAVECKVDKRIRYVTWDFDINFKYRGDLESVSQGFLVSIRHENYSGDLFRTYVFKDVGVEGNRPTYTLRASVSAEIIPTDLVGQYRVKLKGRDGETETIVRKYYE